MKLNSEMIKKTAIQYGADLVGIGDIDLYEGFPLREDPKQICPTAKCVITAAFRIPNGVIECMTNGSQPYTYTALGVKANAEERSTVFLMRMARLIEDAGYEACVQRTSPNLLLRDDEGTNPEVREARRLYQSIAVAEGKPEPDVLLNFDKAGVICGLGTLGCRGNLLTPQFGPMQRLVVIVTNAPLEPDPVCEEALCDQCGLCADACPGHVIERTADGWDYDTWSCSVYYRGAHKSNPLMNDSFLRGDPERERIMEGEKRFSPDEAKKIYPKLDFLPNTQYGYVPCLCGKRCDTACYQHLKDTGRLRIREQEIRQ